MADSKVRKKGSTDFNLPDWLSGVNFWTLMDAN